MTFRAEIVIAAGRHGLDPDLVQAVVEKESTYRPWAWNPEPKYHYLWNVRTNEPFRALKPFEIASEVPPPDFPTFGGDRDQEWWAQQASWGLGQIMGAVAREHGFRGQFLTELCDPLVNLEYICLNLGDLDAWARGKYRGLATSAARTIRVSTLAAYNGGRGGNAPTNVPIRNKDYADSVISIFDRIRQDGQPA